MSVKIINIFVILVFIIPNKNNKMIFFQTEKSDGGPLKIWKAESNPEG